MRERRSLKRLFLKALGIVGLILILALWAQNEKRKEQERRTMIAILQEEAKESERALIVAEGSSDVSLVTSEDDLVSRRRISPEQILKVQQRIAGRTSRVRIVCMENDPEALAYSRDIAKALHPWKVQRARFRWYDSKPHGISILGSSPSDMELVHSAFREAGILFEGKPFKEMTFQSGIVPTVTDRSVEILVGAKPPGE